MRETFINIFVDDIGLIQNKIAFNQNRHLSIGIHHCNIFRFVEQIHIPYFKNPTPFKLLRTGNVERMDKSCRNTKPSFSNFSRISKKVPKSGLCYLSTLEHFSVDWPLARARRQYRGRCGRSRLHREAMEATPQRAQMTESKKRHRENH